MDSIVGVSENDELELFQTELSTVMDSEVVHAKAMVGGKTVITADQTKNQISSLNLGLCEKISPSRVEKNPTLSASAKERLSTVLKHLEHTPSVTIKGASSGMEGGPASVQSATHTKSNQIKTLEKIYSKLDRMKKSLQDESEKATQTKEFYEIDFPNLAQVAVETGLLKEASLQNQLEKHAQEAQKHQKDIDLLLDLSSELTAMRGDRVQMSEKMKSILAELKERGIDHWRKDTTILSKEEISELKTLSSAQVDKIRSNIQILFTTKIQVLIQSIGQIMEILKDIIRNNTQLVRTANRLPGH